MAPATDDVIAALDALREEVECCSACVLAETRTRAVFGEGDPGADLMFVGEAPGYHEDQQGRPFVGQAGKLLEQLLASIGLTREQVYIANVLKSRPPNNRDPFVEEIDACRPYLWRQIEIIKPRVICTLGNFATKLLSGDQRGITKVHGQPRVAAIAGLELYLYPIFHPAAALYTPANLATLKEDFLRLPQLLTQTGGPAAPERPAWRPPERLRTQAASPAVQAAPTLEAAAAAPTLEDALVGAPTLEDASESPAQALAADSERCHKTTAAPHAEVAPALDAETDGAPAAGPDPALARQMDPAPGSQPGPPAEPEQLGLF